MLSNRQINKYTILRINIHTIYRQFNQLLTRDVSIRNTYLGIGPRTVTLIRQIRFRFFTAIRAPPEFRQCPSGSLRAKWNRRGATPACPGCLSPFEPGRRAQIVLRTILIRRLPQGSTNSSNRSVKFVMRSPPGVERLRPLRLFIQGHSTAEQRLDVRRHGVSITVERTASRVCIARTRTPGRPASR